MIEIHPFRGARVRHPSRGELLEAYAVRAELEALGARLGAEFAATNEGWSLRAATLADEVLGDLVLGLGLALVVVLVILALDFRSFKWALVAYVPLLLTILLIYGVVGFIGKDFDMPLSVMSTLSLGMAVDFAIHFVSRFRQRRMEVGAGETAQESLAWTAARPGKGIIRNAVLFAAAFSVMMAAPLTPYVAVGAFIVSMMLISALLTLLLLPALIMLGRRWLLNEGETK